MNQPLRIPMFVPTSSSRLQSLAGWILGRWPLLSNVFRITCFPNYIQAYSYLVAATSTFASWSSKKKLEKTEKSNLFSRRPELVDPRSVARGEGRQVMKIFRWENCFLNIIGNCPFIFMIHKCKRHWLKWSKLHTFHSIDSQSFYLVAQLDSNHISSNKEIYQHCV